MPITYPGIIFNNSGICNFCTNHKERKYFGEEYLRNKILSHIRPIKDRDYDCLIGFSGGRDSTYLLYYFTRVLGFKVLAYTVDNGFIPETTIENIKRISRLLNVDHIFCKTDSLKKTLRHSILSLSASPSAAMVGLLCSGCRLALQKTPYDILKKYNIPVRVTGGTPFEGSGYKTNLLRFNVNSKSNASLVCGYLSEISKNFKWITDPYASIIQFKEFVAHYGRVYNKIIDRKKIFTVLPFYSYIRWEETKILSTLAELKWEQNPSINSTWRGDCDIALLKLYLYKKLLGYNDKDDGLSCLIRDGQIQREEAIERLRQESVVSEAMIRDLFRKVGLNYSDFHKKFENIKPIEN